MAAAVEPTVKAGSEVRWGRWSAGGGGPAGSELSGRRRELSATLHAATSWTHVCEDLRQGGLGEAGGAVGGGEQVAERGDDNRRPTQASGQRKQGREQQQEEGAGGGRAGAKAGCARG